MSLFKLNTMSILLCHKIKLDYKIRYSSRSKCLGFYKHDSWTVFLNMGNNHTALAVHNIQLNYFYRR